jgi:hypothetical protein
MQRRWHIGHTKHKTKINKTQHRKLKKNGDFVNIKFMTLNTLFQKFICAEAIQTEVGPTV